jgi:tetratricopeptide (TPR) repeat protein
VDWLNNVVLAGWLAWCVHSLIDFNIQVPGTVGVAVVLLLLLKTVRAERPKSGGEESPDANKENATATRVGGEFGSGVETGTIKSRLFSATAAILAAATITLSLDRWTVETNQSGFMAACGVGVMRKVDWTPPSDAEFDALLEKCVKAAPYSPFPWICAGNYFQRMREWGRSKYYFKEAVKRSPARASVHYHLFLARAALGEFEKASRSIDKAAELFPNAYARIAKEYKNAH